MGQVQYPGVMAPWEEIFDLRKDAATWYFPAGDQVECDHPDPQPFESFFEPFNDTGNRFPYDQFTRAPEYDLANQVDRDHPDPDPFEYFFAPFLDTGNRFPYDQFTRAPDYDYANQVDRDHPDPDAFDYIVDQPLINIDPTGAATYVFFDTGAQIDRGDPDPDTFDYAFERWVEISAEAVETETPISAPGGPTAFFYDDSYIDPSMEFSFERWVEIPAVEVETPISLPGGPTAFFYDDSYIDPVSEWSFERWVEIDESATIVMSVQFFTAVDMVSQPDETVLPDISGMEPWTDVQTVTPAEAPIWMFEADPAQDETAIQAEAVERWAEITAAAALLEFGIYDFPDAILSDEEPVADDLMMEVWAPIDDAGVFWFTDTILEDDDRVPPVMEWSFETWTDVAVVTPADAPLWYYDADPAQDDSTFLPEFWFEPWVDRAAVTAADSVLWAYDADPAQDDSTFLPEFWFEPWEDRALVTPADATLWGFEADPAQDDSTFLPEFSFERWTEQEAVVVPPDVLWIRCTIEAANPITTVVDTCNKIAVTLNPVTRLETIMAVAATQLTAREFDLGQLVCITAYFRDINGTLTDPTNVYFAMRAHAVGVTTTLTYGVDAALTKDAVGTYHVNIDTNESGGRWEWNFYSTGTGQAADHDYFQVKPTIAV